jgi:Na+/H+ antiporter NhaA
MVAYLVVAVWYVLEKSWIHETICDAVRPKQLPLNTDESETERIWYQKA